MFLLHVWKTKSRHPKKIVMNGQRKWGLWNNFFHDYGTFGHITTLIIPIDACATNSQNTHYFAKSQN